MVPKSYIECGEFGALKKLCTTCNTANKYSKQKGSKGFTQNYDVKPALGTVNNNKHDNKSIKEGEYIKVRIEHENKQDNQSYNILSHH